MWLSKQQDDKKMKITNPISLLKNCGFHKYNAKSNGESLLIHSYNTYFLACKLAERYITGLNVDDITKIELASLLHDYGKTYSEFQKKLHGPHKLKEEDVPTLKKIIHGSVKGLTDSDSDDIIYMIQNHHGVDLERATNNRGRLTRIVSICDTIVSNEYLTHDTIYALNGLIDSIEYEFILIELIDHPISSYLIGVFDFVYKRNGIEPILFTKNSTLFVKKKSKLLPTLSEVNEYLNNNLEALTSEGGTVVNFDNTNNRIYTNPDNFLKLALIPSKFLEDVTQQVSKKLASFKKYKEEWTEEEEKKYLYGRVCGWIHDSIIELCKIKDEAVPKGGGGRPDKTTVQFIEQRYGKGISYKMIIQKILEKYQDKLKCFKGEKYDITELLVSDSLLNNVKDIQKEAKTDYDRYWDRKPTSVCRTCNNFEQVNTTAALFPASELGGTTDVFYTDLMRRSPELKEKGGGICRWCLLWFILMKSKCANRMYKLCILPHGVFGRIDWDAIFNADQIISIGNPQENYIYPHVAVTGLSGTTYSSFISQIVKTNGVGDSMLQKLYENGLRGKIISTLIEPSNTLLECGGVTIDTTEYDLLKIVLEHVIATKKSNNFYLVVRAMKQKTRGGNDFPYGWGMLIKTKKLEEDKNMINELGEKTGLSFLDAVGIGDKDRVSSAEKVVRRMNETLRKLNNSEDTNGLLDAMIAIGLKTAIATRDFETWQDERKQTEIEAFRKMAEKIYAYKNDSSKRTELVRSMAYYLAYVSKGGTEK